MVEWKKRESTLVSEIQMLKEALYDKANEKDLKIMQMEALEKELLEENASLREKMEDMKENHRYRLTLLKTELAEQKAEMEALYQKVSNCFGIQ